MRVLVTADLHYNQARSRPLAEQIIDEMNQAGGDVLLVVGDTASPEGDYLERCLGRFKFAGPKLLVAGNHELWTHGGDSYSLLEKELPRRAREIGWHWLQDEPVVIGDVAFVGSVGWYDYSFAAEGLGIPRRFYERKISPGAAERFSEMADLFEGAEDIPPAARAVVARWNDGRFIRLGRSDGEFLDELLERLRRQLDSLEKSRTVVAGVHHLPFRELLPPSHSAQWDFAKAYLGSEKIGELLMRYGNVSHVFCGHSHFPAEVRKGRMRAINVGSGYRHKRFWAETLRETGES